MRFNRALTLIALTIAFLCAGKAQWAVSQEYTIGMEDVLVVAIPLLEAPNNRVQVTVGPDGSIALPEPIFTVQAAGLTPRQLEAAIVQKLRSFVTDPGAVEGLGASVQVTGYNSRKISIFGAVLKQGDISFAQIPSFPRVLAQAGGLAPNADGTQLRILPADPESPTIEVNFDQLIRELRPAWPKLSPGDTIFVPSKPPKVEEVAPTQEVTEPTPEATVSETEQVIVSVSYPFKKLAVFPFAKPPMLAEVLTAAGVPLELNILQQIEVIRNGKPLVIDMERFGTSGEFDVFPVLQSGDLVNIKSADSSPHVTVVGQVTAPGSYPLDTATDLLDILAKAGGVTAAADTERIQVSREVIKGFIGTQTINLEEQAFVVKPGDNILIPIRDPQRSQGFFRSAIGLLRDTAIIVNAYRIVF